MIATAGDKPVTGITRAAIVAGRDRRAKTPFQGRHFLDAMHGLFGWALDAQHVKSDPTHGVAYPAAPVTRSGPRPKCNNTNAAGPSAPDSGCGSTCCSIRVCAVACRALWTAAHSRQCGYYPSTKERRHGHRNASYFARTRGDSESRTVRRSDIHRWRSRSSSDQRILATNSARLVARLACPVRRTAYASSVQRAPLIMARRNPNWKRSSVGPAATWRRSIRDQQIAGVFRWPPCTS